MNAHQWSDLSKLLSGLADAFALEGRTGGKQAEAALRNARKESYRRTVASSDPSRVLKTVCDLPDADDLAALVLNCEAMLDWTSWKGEGLASDVSANLYTTELVGPDGHIPAADVRVGLLISEAWTDYPISSHSGEETYLVISGNAEWIVGEKPYRTHPPRTYVHHPSWVLHGRRTGEEPFLGAWRWSGDLDLSTFSVD